MHPCMDVCGNSGNTEILNSEMMYICEQVYLYCMYVLIYVHVYLYVMIVCTQTNMSVCLCIVTHMKILGFHIILAI